MRRIAPLSALTGVAAALRFPPTGAAAHPELTRPDARCATMGGGQKARAPSPRIRESMSTESEADQAGAPRRRARGSHRGRAGRRRRVAAPPAPAHAARRPGRRRRARRGGHRRQLGGGANGAKSRPGRRAEGHRAPSPARRSRPRCSPASRRAASTSASPSAPVRLVEFADLQCPFCREYTLQIAAPARAGLRAHAARSAWSSATSSFLGKDSVTAGRAAAAAARAEQALELRRRLLLQPGRGELGLRDAELPAAHRQGRRGRRGQGRRRSPRRRRR